MLKIIDAKFPSTCPLCLEPIAIGARIAWSPGERARHVACADRALTQQAATPAPDVTVQPRKRTRRTGCRCGSRETLRGELVPSNRNCANCEHEHEHDA